MADTPDTVSKQLSRIETAKSEIKDAIINKGVAVPTTALIDEYPDYISQISTGIVPTGTINISQKTGTDVTNFATANVNDAAISYSTGPCSKPTIEVNSNGLITATYSDTNKSFMATGTAGWYAGEVFSLNLSSSNTKQLDLVTAPAPTVSGNTVSYTLGIGYHKASETKTATIPGSDLRIYFDAQNMDFGMDYDISIEDSETINVNNGFINGILYGSNSHHLVGFETDYNYQYIDTTAVTRFTDETYSPVNLPLGTVIETITPALSAQYINVPVGWNNTIRTIKFDKVTQENLSVYAAEHSIGEVVFDATDTIVTAYWGTSNPASSLGQDGDIYIKY